MDSRTLHAIAGKFHRMQHACDLTTRQEWLWEQVDNELQYRRTSESRGWLKCSCWICFREPML